MSEQLIGIIKEHCPRCNGKLEVDKDRYGWYKNCLMCGYLKDLDGRTVEYKKLKLQKNNGSTW